MIQCNHTDEYTPELYKNEKGEEVELKPYKVSAFKVAGFNLKKCTKCGQEMKVKTKIGNAWLRVKK